MPRDINPVKPDQISASNGTTTTKDTIDFQASKHNQHPLLDAILLLHCPSNPANAISLIPFPGNQ